MIVQTGGIILNKDLAEFHFDGDIDAAWEYFRYAIDAAHEDLQRDFKRWKEESTAGAVDNAAAAVTE